uniref:Uncharacterized protein n=1 Tax=Periophthalmus magnuspinnatus TaxID=409849 RepID=A0A3B4A3B1_9GOBI
MAVRLTSLVSVQMAGACCAVASVLQMCCVPGVVLPVWNPQNPSAGDKVARAIVYFVALIYMFLGMSIIADRFMSSIEVITSQEKEITIKKSNGETTTATVRIWNETVSNLTLMALGSSAPEILLSVIEVCGHNFEAGSLGPSTIVGSAAFNMFVIIALCVYVVPDGETRKIKHLRVFFVTAAWSIFAYIWLYLILSVFSPGEVQVWEAVLTFLCFPLCVVQAWVADRRLLFYKYVRKRYRADKSRGVIIESEGGDMLHDGLIEEGRAKDEEEEARRDMARTLKELKQRHPDKDMEQLIEMANYQVLMQQQKSRAFYRIQATRMMIGAGNILKKHAADQARKVPPAPSFPETQAQEDDPHTVRLDFEPALYQCFENCGSLKLSVSRNGGDPGVTVKVYTNMHTCYVYRLGGDIALMVLYTAKLTLVSFKPCYNIRGARTPLPGIFLSNVRSLSNKTDELALLMRRNKDFSSSCVLCFTETWLNERILDCALQLEGFQLLRADRQRGLSGGKTKGGSVCFYINNAWCTDVTVISQHCSPAVEYLFMNCRPFYSPHEFTSFILAAVYIPPCVDTHEAKHVLAEQLLDVE